MLTSFMCVESVVGAVWVPSPGQPSQVLRPQLLLRLRQKLVSTEAVCGDAGEDLWAWASLGLWSALAKARQDAACGRDAAIPCSAQQQRELL